MLSAIDNDKPPTPPQYAERNDDFREFGTISLESLTAKSLEESAKKLDYSRLSPARRQAVDYSARLACDSHGVLVAARAIAEIPAWQPAILTN